MVDYFYLSVASVSALMSYIAGAVFIKAYLQEKKTARAFWALAFFLYGTGHLINAGLIALDIAITSELGTAWTWLYVVLGGTGIVGVILYSTVPFLTKKPYYREIITLLFEIPYLVGVTMFGLLLPDDTPFAWINPTSTHVQVVNMSWFVVIMVVPFSFFIGIVFLRYYNTSRTQWSLLIGISFILYALILFIWPVAELKPLFYALRTVSVFLLAYGGVLLAKE